MSEADRKAEARELREKAAKVLDSIGGVLMKPETRETAIDKLMVFAAHILEKAEASPKPGEPAARSVTGIEQLLDELCTSPDKTYCQRGRSELRRILVASLTPRTEEAND